MFLLWLIEKKWEEMFEKRTVIDTDIEASQTNFYEIKEEVTGIKKSRRFYKNYISRR